MIDRDQAWELVKSRCDFSLQRHLAHVAAAMEAMCQKFGSADEVDQWYITGLLHDIDWNETINHPEKHCGEETAAYLKQHKVPDELIVAIRSHCDWQNLPRDNNLKKSLAAIDELSGFAVAVALMRPTRMIGIKAKSITKKMKDKHFAKNVSRQDMLLAEEYFAIKLPELLDQILLPAFVKIADKWELSLS